MEQQSDDADSLSSKSSSPEMTEVSTATAEYDDDVTGNHSIDIHCVVESIVTMSSPEKTLLAADDVTQTPPPSVDTLNDQVVRLAARCPFAELVPAVLCRLGYGLDDCIAAEGTILVRNWKPVSCHSVADSPTATVGLVLGGTLSSMVTLKIRLHRMAKSLTSEEIQDKMAAYICDHLTSELDQNNCSVDKTTLEAIINREFVSGLIPDTFRLALTRWYANRAPTPHPEADWQEVNNMYKLDDWFRDDPNPSDDRISEYVRLLNGTRQRHHVTFDYVSGWFAECRRRRHHGNGLIRQLAISVADKPHSKKPPAYIGELKIDCGESIADCRNDGSMTSSQPRQCSPPPIVRRVPVLPNRNAVYVLDAILPKLETQVDNRKRPRDDNVDNDDDDEQEMEIVCDSDVDDDNAAKDPADVVAGGKIEGNGKKDGNLISFQEEATDLRVRKIACRSDSGASVGSGGEDDRSPRNSPSDSGRQPTATSVFDDDRYLPSRVIADRNGSSEDYFSGGTKNNSNHSSATGDSPTYPGNAMALIPNRMLFPNGPTPTPPPSHPLTSLYQHHQRALQLAAMSRAAALGFHLTGHGFAQSAAAAVAASGGRPPSHGNGINEDFRNYGSVGFDGKAMRNASAIMLSDRSNTDLVGGHMSKPGCSPMGLGSGAGQGSGCGGVLTSSPGDPNANNGNKRSRVFIDPLTEIPKLERWFADDTHPSSYVIEKYTDELNRAPYRQRFPRLEPKNLQLWFKNHRAKMKRQREACSAAAAAAAAVVAAAASAANSPNGDRNRNHSMSGANGFAMIRQVAQPYMGDAIADKLQMQHQQQQLFGSRGLTGGRNDSVGRSGDNNNRSGPTAAEVIGLMSAAAAAANGISRGDDDEDEDDRYDDEDEDSADAEKTNYGKRTSSDDDDDQQRDNKYFPVVTSGFTCGSGGGGAGGGNNGGGSELFSNGGNNNYKDMRRDMISGGSSNYTTVGSSRNGGGGVSGALDALVLRLQNGPFAAHSATKPEVH